MDAGAQDRLIKRAARRFRVGDIAGAESLAREILEGGSDHPEALQILGQCHFERGEPERALRSLLLAASSIRSIQLTPSVQYAVLSDLNFMFTQALSGLDSSYATAKRADYVHWLTALKHRQLDATPLVGVVLLVFGSANWLRAALNSISRVGPCGIAFILTR